MVVEIRWRRRVPSNRALTRQDFTSKSYHLDHRTPRHPQIGPQSRLKLALNGAGFLRFFIHFFSLLFFKFFRGSPSMHFGKQGVQPGALRAPVAALPRGVRPLWFCFSANNRGSSQCSHTRWREPLFVFKNMPSLKVLFCSDWVMC